MSGFGQGQQTQMGSEETRLRQEFSQLDRNGDGKVDRDEMDAYLAQRGIDDEHRSQIVDEIFEKLDQDHNGHVDLNEFTQQYISTKN